MNERSRRRRRSHAPRRRRRIALSRHWLTAFAALAITVAAALWLSSTPSDPERALERARAHEAAGEMREARVEAMNAVQGDPGDPEAWLTLARAQLALDDHEAAAASIERARENGAPPGATRHLMAEAAIGLGDIDGALAETAAADIPGELLPQAARMRGRAFAVDGDLARAAEAYDYALEHGEESAGLWTDIARFRIDSGELAGAIEAADRAVELGPENVEALVLKGRLARQQYGLVAGLAWFERALEVDENHVGALLERAATLGELGRAAEMLEVTRRVLELSRDNAEAYYLQAVLAARARDFALARRLVELIGGRLDGRPAMMLFDGALEYREGNYEAAVRRLDELIELQPANRSAIRLKGAAQFHGGDLAGAVETLGPLADRADADSYVLTIVGRAWERAGNFERAAPYLARAASPVRGAGGAIAPQEELAVLEARAEGGAAEEVALVRAYLARGMAEEAVARAARLRRANPDAPDAHILYGDALGAAGRFGDAAAAYASAANIRFTEPVVLRMVEALRRAGRAAAAERALALFRQQHPRNVPTALVSAQINLSGGHWRRAAAILEYARSITGDRDAAVLANLAWAWHEAGDSERARALARRAYLLMPSSPATSEIYGWILFDGEADYVLGLEMLEKARALAPGDSGIEWHLAQAYALLDRPEDAREAAENALAIPGFGARREALRLLRRLG